MPALTWVATTPNTKTGRIPSAYVGSTIEETRGTCQGCALLDNGCYAWAGLTRSSFMRISLQKAETPERYTLAHALKNRERTARVARIGVMGDPSRADRPELLAAVQAFADVGLGVLSYTHFWREPHAAGLEGVCLASCEDIDGAQDARDRGWTPAVLLPWDHLQEVGPTFSLPDDSQGVVCPAQTKPGVTCNDCRMCWLGHPVWEAGKIAAIGFLDHSRAAQRESRASRDQVPLFGPDFRGARDTRPARPLPVVRA